MDNSFNLLYTVEQIRKLEAIAIKEYGISAFTLMQRAGKAAFTELKKNWPKVKNITVVCGKGNNAGDGYVVAYLAKSAKFKVKILQLSPYKTLTGAAKQAALKCQKLKIVTKPFSAKELKGTGVIVDAILGTGLTGKVKPNFSKVITAINSSKIPVFALDLPSGIDGDTGALLGDAIRADVTITFIGHKIGLLVGQARDYCGKIAVSDLGLHLLRHSRTGTSSPNVSVGDGNPFSKLDSCGEKLVLATEIKSLKPRKKTAHKGDFGHVLVIGGDAGMSGAVRIAAEAALRVGTGRVTIATRKELEVLADKVRPEIMIHGVDSGKQLKPLLDRATVVVIGPGLGSSRWGKNLFNTVIKSDKPLVIDADALNILAKKPISKDNWILTPHPGEAARLLGITNKKVQLDRVRALKGLQAVFGGVTVLKGAGSLVTTQGERIGVCDAGNPGMAGPGMGDLLSGIIAGLVAQNLSLFAAAKLGVLVHALAGDLVAEKHGQLGMVALDLLPEVRDILNAALKR